MHAINVNIILHVIQLKIDAYKEHIRHCFLFCFFIKRKVLMHTIIYMRHVVKIL